MLLTSSPSITSTCAPRSAIARAMLWPMKPAPPMSAIRRPDRSDIRENLLDGIHDSRDVRLDYVGRYRKRDGALRDAGCVRTTSVVVAVPAGVVGRVRQRLGVVDARPDTARLQRIDDRLALLVERFGENG